MNHDDLLKRADRILAISRMCGDPSDAALLAEKLAIALRAEVEAHAKADAERDVLRQQLTLRPLTPEDREDKVDRDAAGADEGGG